ncbi:Leucine-rich repeat [Macleaya cordata]|uniref:Leucine-rich repeat n=1 Tax=Macleaya cordata TaxID=56857 RepID=A0A200PN48_MACCD|nr:Leucine-rich repeat [Macleaya cordata]
MAKMSCFAVLAGRKKKSKGEKQSSDPLDYKKELGTLQLKLVKKSEVNGLNSTSFSISVPFGNQKNSTCDVKVMNDESIVRAEAVEVAYEGGDEGDEDWSIKRDLSGFNFQSQVANKGEEKNLSLNRDMGSFNTINDTNDQLETESEREAEVGDQLIQSGHVSDPGMGKAEFWATPILKRSCSNLETSDMLKKIADQLPPSKSHSFEDLENLAYRVREEFVAGIRGSPMSVMTPCSADRVMLKKHSSSQVLPSRSRRIWWKLFLWSHRNLHKPLTVKTRLPATKESSKQKGGYCSDTLEPSRPSESSNLKLKSPVSFTEESENNNKFHKWGNFDSRFSGFWPQNQWVAFSTESSSLKRVDEWVNNLEIEPPLLLNDEENGDEGIFFPPSPEAGESSARVMTHMNQQNIVNLSEEVLHANSVIQSLNSSSTVAHVSAMSLKVIPTISHFSSLRTVNLSGNFIVRITPGSLPKGLHTLNLSRNKIVAIEGLRELTRLRVLDLSYNRISRIGHGLSNCTLIKELYLAGNKISDLEGLHRLLKLTVLDLSFNKVTTAKSLGQLVANYNSLLALNLLGNPIQSNIGDDQLRKVISGILPQLAYLNKQPIKQQRTREVAMDSVAKAALGNNGWTSRRKQSKRVSQGASSSLVKSKSRVGGGQKNKHKSKNSIHHSYSPLIRSSPAVASTSH